MEATHATDGMLAEVQAAQRMIQSGNSLGAAAAIRRARGIGVDAIGRNNRTAPHLRPWVDHLTPLMSAP